MNFVPPESELAVSATRAKRRSGPYPRRSDIVRAITAAKSVGIPVTTIEIGADGAICIKCNNPSLAVGHNDFEQWAAEGRL